jgi:acetyl/propionyl-CoA carboxylase alpha subunit
MSSSTCLKHTPYRGATPSYCVAIKPEEDTYHSIESASCWIHPSINPSVHSFTHSIDPTSTLLAELARCTRHSLCRQVNYSNYRNRRTTRSASPKVHLQSFDWHILFHWKDQSETAFKEQTNTIYSKVQEQMAFVFQACMNPTNRSPGMTSQIADVSSSSALNDPLRGAVEIMEVREGQKFVCLRLPRPFRSNTHY